MIEVNHPPLRKTPVISRFLKRYLCFKPLYWIEKKIDPQCKVGRPKYKRFSNFVYKVCKWAMF
jgi:hypothetical protein